MSQIPEGEGLSEDTLKISTLNQYHTATTGYYHGRQQTLTNMYHRILRELKDAKFVFYEKDIVHTENVSPLELTSFMYGLSLYHPVGVSSYKRAFMAGSLTEHRGIDPFSLVDIASSAHGEELLQKKDPGKFWEIHGNEGTGFVQKDVRGRWWRSYDRSGSKTNLTYEYDEVTSLRVQEALKVIAEMPFISLETLGCMFDRDIIKLLLQLARTDTNSVLVNFGRSLVEAKHAYALKLTREGYIDYDLVMKAQKLWQIIVLNRGSSLIEDMLMITQTTLLQMAEVQRMRAEGAIQKAILDYLVSMGYARYEKVYGEYTRQTDNFLYKTFLKFVGLLLV